MKLVTPAGLRAARADAAISVVELANRSGVSRTTIWEWESGRVSERPRVPVARALTAALAGARAELEAASPPPARTLIRCAADNPATVTAQLRAGLADCRCPTPVAYRIDPGRFVVVHASAACPAVEGLELRT